MAPSCTMPAAQLPVTRKGSSMRVPHKLVKAVSGARVCLPRIALGLTLCFSMGVPGEGIYEDGQTCSACIQSAAHTANTKTSATMPAISRNSSIESIAEYVENVEILQAKRATAVKVTYVYVRPAQVQPQPHDSDVTVNKPVSTIMRW
ncbi:hypothetical protein BC628DRAFT_148630 [Trametes gibbosa]|nr:hypothetical protein BC628DRAFT_148630 [Trametes gibbosa]